MGNQPVAIVFILNKSETDGVDIEEALTPHFKLIVKNLVSEGYIQSKEEFEKIFDGQFVYFVRLADSDFQKLAENEELIGATAIDVYKVHNKVQPGEDIHALHYDADKAPWGFGLYVATLYSI